MSYYVKRNCLSRPVALPRLTYIVGIVLALLLTLVGSVQAQERPLSGGTLVIGLNQSPIHLNPAVLSTHATIIAGAQLFASLLRYDDNGNLQPYLAKDWGFSKDGLILTLHLRQDANFHDGRPITSDDVAYSINAVKRYHPFKSMLAPVREIRIPDSYTVEVILTHPHPTILLVMGSGLLPILPKHIYDDGTDLRNHPRNVTPVGSGPFKLTEFKPGEHVILTKNDQFFLEGKPYLDRIIIKIYKDSTSMGLAAERGEIDMVPFISSLREIDRLEKDPHLNVTAKGYSGVGAIAWLAFNQKNNFLKDKRVRQAISYAIDRDYIVQKLLRGAPVKATGPINHASPFYSSDVKTYDLNIEMANRLLDEAGFPIGSDGVRFSLKIDYIPGNDENSRNIAEYLRPQLKTIGIDVTVRSLPDMAEWVNHVANYNFDMTIDILYNWGDPVIGVHRTYMCSNIRKGVPWANTQNYCNSRVDALLEQASREMILEKRKALYAEFQQIVTDELPVAYIHEPAIRTIFRDSVRNPPETMWGAMAPMDDVYLKD